jgi:hypothetical protein
MPSLVIICKLLLAFVVVGTSSLLQTSAFGAFVAVTSIQWSRQQQQQSTTTTRPLLRLDATSQQGKTTTNSDNDDDNYDLKSIKIGDRDFWIRQKSIRKGGNAS